MTCRDCVPVNEHPDVSNDTSENVLLRPGMDKILHILSAPHRRLILLLLKAGTVETETDVMIRRKGDSTSTEIAVIHGHLPKLAEAGYIEWDRTNGEVSKGPCFDEIEPFLEMIEKHADELPPDWP